MLTRRANAGAPNKEQFGLVQYPNNTHQRGNSCDRDQKRKYRNLSPIEVIVL